jgi:tctex1 domain-containing protein 2
VLTDTILAHALQVVKEELAGKKFDEQEAKEWSLNIADTIRDRVRQLNIPRYKVIVQVTIGQMLDQGVRVASRCLWDTATDNYAR